MKNIKTLIVGMLIGAGLTFSTGAMAAVSNQVTAVFKDLKIVVNGKTAELDARPLTYNGTTYLPLREVGNQLGYDVTYKADSATIELKNSAATAASAKEVSSVQSTATYKLGDTIQLTGATFKLTSTEYLLTSDEAKNKGFTKTYEIKAGEKILRIKYDAFVGEDPQFGSDSSRFISQVATNDGKKGYKNLLIPLADANQLVAGSLGSYDIGILIKSNQTVTSIDIVNPLNQNETVTVQVGS